VTDTPPKVEKLYREMLMRRSGADRLRMGAAMFEAAKRLVRASLGDPDGRDDSVEMRVKIFLRVYGPDFDPATRERVVTWLHAFAAIRDVRAGGANLRRAPSPPPDWPQRP
jgi:hypothetical protein